MNRKALLVIAVFVGAALCAHAQNLVVNGGFETGDFTGWTQFGDTDFTGVSTMSPGGIPPHSGNYLAYFGPLSDGGIMQTLPVPAGTYPVDFWLAADGGGAGDYITVTLGGVTIYSAPGSGTFGWTQITGTATTGANPVLAFHFVNVPSYWALDDVAVGLVPEPGTLALIALGALGLVVTLRKRLLV